MRKQLTSAALLTTSFFFLTGFAKKSDVAAQSSVKDKTVELEFKIVPNKDMVISKDGHWNIQLTNTQGLKLETKNGIYESKGFDENLPGFKIKAELDGAATAGKVDYTMKAFVCDINKTQCFPQVHKGSLEWKKS
ncbi:hypothetical protein [Oligoflexus tunisiensis]|uniref:hypothetical protein n=1 Tax=Oligoflexus tunisiensis TaxID=708132 RepID=UPI00114CDE52|nr:hypothetical protein [Oligoflexus tunisiensis]